MAIGRSLTKKGSRYGLGFSSSSEESNSKRNSLSKTQISAPVALISTTNMISYTSPSLRTSQSASSMSSSASSSPTSAKFPSSPFSTSSGSETEATDPPSPEPAMTPPPNHLSTYFSTGSVPKPPSPLRTLSNRSVNSKTGSTTKAPPVPIARSNSRTTAWPGQHTKALHSLTRSGSQHHPFGNELAKVAEMTEELTSKKDAEELFMVEHGLQKFSAKDYESEIWGELGGVFEDALPKLAAGWI